MLEWFCGSLKEYVCFGKRVAFSTKLNARHEWLVRTHTHTRSHPNTQYGVDDGKTFQLLNNYLLLLYIFSELFIILLHNCAWRVCWRVASMQIVENYSQPALAVSPNKRIHISFGFHFFFLLYLFIAVVTKGDAFSLSLSHLFSSTMCTCASECLCIHRNDIF